MRKYNTLFIDLDDTLLDYSADEINCLLTVFEKNGLPHSDDVVQLYNEIEVWQAFEMGQEITAKTIVSNKIKQLLKMLEVSKENIFSITDEFYDMMAKCHKVKHGAIKVLTELKNRGYNLFITTNGFPDFQYKRIKASKISKYFDGIFISEEINVSKPSRSFFEYVIKHVPESDRSRILVIGDAPKADVFGGINSGLDTCWLNEKGKTCKYNPNFTINKITELLDIL